MAKSIYRQRAAEYRSLAEAARSQEQRLLLLSLASEWEALAEASATRSKHRGYVSAPHTTVANRPERLAA